MYCHTNKINNKKYIGITNGNPKKRWRNGHGYDKQFFGKAIKKHGWNSFKHEIIFSRLTKSQAERKEFELIKLNRTTNADYGYNVSPGVSPTTKDIPPIAYNTTLIQMLQKELDIKNKQIEELTTAVRIQAESIKADRHNELAETIIDGRLTSPQPDEDKKIKQPFLSRLFKKK